MRLRTILMVGGVLLVTVASAVCTALVLITGQMSTYSDAATKAAWSIYLGDEVQVSLYRFSRAQLRPPSDARRVEQQAAANVLRTNIERASANAGNGPGRALIGRLSEQVEAYLSTPDGAADGLRQDRLEAALASSQELVQLNLARAEVASERAQRWNRLADVIGIGAAVLLIAGTGIVLFGASAMIYRPLVAIRSGLDRTRRHGRFERITPTGPVEMREIASELNEMTETLSRRRQLQLGFLAAVAHDLRNPLGALKLVATLRSGQPLPDESAIRRKFALIRKQVDRLDRLITDLLDTTRLESGNFHLEVGEHDLSALVRECAALHMNVSARHPIVVDAPPSLPVACDAGRVSQVLNNLVNNAIKYSPEGGAVRVRGWNAEDGVHFSVTDEGVGISKTDFHHIFEPFRRSKDVSETIPGVGLGLWASRRIVEAHGGRLEVRSEPGQGSTFEVVLPQASVALHSRDLRDLEARQWEQ